MLIILTKAEIKIQSVTIFLHDSCYYWLIFDHSVVSLAATSKPGVIKIQHIQVLAHTENRMQKSLNGERYGKMTDVTVKAN